jgi:hypothetical protein
LSGILVDAGKETDTGDNGLNTGQGLGDLAQEINDTNTTQIDITLAKTELCMQSFLSVNVTKRIEQHYYYPAFSN